VVKVTTPTPPDVWIWSVYAALEATSVVKVVSLVCVISAADAPVLIATSPAAVSVNTQREATVKVLALARTWET
jgi:hypothetical protein